MAKPIETMNDNMKRLEARTVAAAEAALAARKFVTAIDVLQGIGWLPQARVDEWRQSRLAYLEGGVSANLHKISAVMRMFRRWALSRGLAPRETAYVSRTRDRHQLRFSKSGELSIERAYRTHWVSPELAVAKRAWLAERQGRAPDLAVISRLTDQASGLSAIDDASAFPIESRDDHPTRFTNFYTWGDFKGDPADLMKHYFDAFVYVTNWAHTSSCFGLPERLLSPADAVPYCTSESLQAGPTADILERVALEVIEFGAVALELDEKDRPEEVCPATLG